MPEGSTDRLDGAEMVLSTGGSLRFSSNQPHSWLNDIGRMARSGSPGTAIGIGRTVRDDPAGLLPAR